MEWGNFMIVAIAAMILTSVMMTLVLLLTWAKESLRESAYRRSHLQSSQLGTSDTTGKWQREKETERNQNRPGG
jgi:hypothetical protein